MIYCARLGAAMGRLGTGDWLSLDSGQRARSYLAHNIALAAMGERTFQTILRNAVSRLYWWGVKPVTVAPDSFPFRFDSFRFALGSLFIFIVGALIASILWRGWEEAAAERKNTQPAAAAAAAVEAQKTLEFQLIGYRRRHRCRAKSCHVPPSDYIAKIYERSINNRFTCTSKCVFSQVFPTASFSLSLSLLLCFANFYDGLKYFPTFYSVFYGTYLHCRNETVDFIRLQLTDFRTLVNFIWLTDTLYIRVYISLWYFMLILQSTGRRLFTPFSHILREIQGDHCKR